jgi:hypothetical protein
LSRGVARSLGRWGSACALLFCFAAAKPAQLPQLGTQYKPLPAGEGKAQVEAACLPCHSADLLAQQRLTEKQWTASVDKMVRWGAVVPDSEKAKLVLYLSKNFGPENTFDPTKIAPAH